MNELIGLLLTVITIGFGCIIYVLELILYTLKELVSELKKS